jgi:hypothetical protein
MPMLYTYLIWSVLLVLLWSVVFVFTRNKKKMLTMSLGTAPLGLTEPLFYPEPGILEPSNVVRIGGKLRL